MWSPAQGEAEQNGLCAELSLQDIKSGLGDRSETRISSGELWAFLLSGEQAEGGENQPQAKLEEGEWSSGI